MRGLRGLRYVFSVSAVEKQSMRIYSISRLIKYVENGFVNKCELDRRLVISPTLKHAESAAQTRKVCHRERAMLLNKYAYNDI